MVFKRVIEKTEEEIRVLDLAILGLETKIRQSEEEHEENKLKVKQLKQKHEESKRTLKEMKENLGIE